jgi:copper chaperone CopZ
MGYYVHDIPGRLRVKSPLLKGDSGEGTAVRELLEGMAGVQSAGVNPLTGSLVVCYDPSALGGKEILDVLERRRVFHGALARTNDEVVRAGVHKAGKKIGKAAFSLGLSLAMESAGLGFLAMFI